MEEIVQVEETENVVETENKSKRKKIISGVIAFIMASIFFMLGDAFFRNIIWDNLIIRPASIVFAMFFGIVIFSLVTAITKKASRAVVICNVSVAILAFISGIKAIFTGEPLYFSDVNFLGTSSDLVKLIIENVDDSFVFWLIMQFTIYAIIIEIFSLLTNKFNIEIKSWKKRLVIVAIDLIIILFLFFPNAYTKNLCLKIFFNTGEYKDFNSYTTNMSFFERFGMINGMYGVVLNNTFVEPEDYDETILNEELNLAQGVTKDKVGKPNILVVFSESFWDVNQLTELTFTEPITSNFNALKSEGNFVNLISPSYGGMSENVAFEFVTGGSMSYFPLGYIPIMSLYSDKDSTKIPSLVKVLKNNGYTSEIVFGKDYYNSEEAYRKIGFDDYSELVFGTQTWVTDEYATDAIIRRLEDKNSEPMFLMLETIESHMPFNQDKYDEYQVGVQDCKLDISMSNTLTTYSQGIYNADKELRRLYEYLKTFKEDTILIFLGDHLPYLYTKTNVNVIDKLEFFNTDDELVNEFRKYNTQALVLSNFDMKIDMPEYMGVDMLFNYVINHLDIEIDPYYKWLYENVNDFAGGNKYVSFDTNGTLYETSKLEGKMKEVYKLKEKMQYKFFINH